MTALLWGRPRWAWAVDVLVVVVFGFVALTTPQAAVRTIAVAAILLRLATAALPVVAWRLRARGGSDRAR